MNNFNSKNVTPQMFLNVLQGKKVTVGSKKVIQRYTWKKSLKS